MPELPIREIECLLVLADELHFGRTAERLYLSQSRASQLVAALEHKIGTTLVYRTSRTVALTEFGESFVRRLRPRYADLLGVVADATAQAARCEQTVLRIGFQGTVYEPVAVAFSAFTTEYPNISFVWEEVPLGDPFSAVRLGRVDAAVVLLPAFEPELIVGTAFPPQPEMLASAQSTPSRSARRSPVTPRTTGSTPTLHPPRRRAGPSRRPRRSRPSRKGCR
ncbi:DNA-binding transcriptional LysR family regulator [Rhodococcus sp. 27YEA15]|uniref:LysR family transcriptional regulator n=1 Tax=Rhodococcus sp. 27YEA15 TaxID=3156259 RepID=UPI003C79AD91